MTEREVVIPDCAYAVRGWLQGMNLDPETIACKILDETDGKWAPHRARNWVQFDRITARFGFSGVTSTLGGRKQKVNPMPEVLTTLAQGITMFLGLEKEPFNFVYCNLYADGEAGIRRHCDKGFLELSHRTTIASLSFGEPRKFEFWPQEDWKNRNKMIGTVLGPGDLCVLHGECQNRYLHSVPQGEGSPMASTLPHLQASSIGGPRGHQADHQDAEEMSRKRNEMTKSGIYKHAKGGIYTVLFIARQSTNGPDEGKNVVVYVSHKTGYVCVRDEEQFHELVEPDPKLGFNPGVKVPRFLFFSAQLSDPQAESLYDDLKETFGRKS